MSEVRNVRAVIIDDESVARDVLEQLINYYCPFIEIVGVGDSIHSGYEIIVKEVPELVFFDIHLAQENSFDLLSKFEIINFGIIFTSGHSDYGVDAFKVNAIDYLLKPIDSDDLVGAVNKFLHQRAQNLDAELLEKEVFISVHHSNKVELISAFNISSCEADDNYVNIVTVENQKYKATKTLRAIEKFLEPSKSFIRISRSVLINVKQISNYTKSDPCIINLRNGHYFEVSRRKKSEVLALLKN